MRPSGWVYSDGAASGAFPRPVRLLFPDLGFEVVQNLLELAFQVGGQFLFVGQFLAEIACAGIDIGEERGLEFLNAADGDIVQNIPACRRR